MQLSKGYWQTYKEVPNDAEIPSHQLMMRAGLIQKMAQGLYTYLPMGLRVLKKVENIIRDVHDENGCLEFSLPHLTPSELWKESGRWETMGEEMLRIQDRGGRDLCFNPTNEEAITDMFRKTVKSYKNMPITLYQITAKFRDEIRPRFGVMRAREFVMKDAYSFDMDKESLDQSYDMMFKVYEEIFTRMGLEFISVEADGGAMADGDAKTHEFQVLATSGEDAVVKCESCGYAANIEKASSKETCPECENSLSEIRGIEVGHIFQLGNKYTESMGVKVLDNTGKNATPLMGCYGIGVSRTVAAAIEQNHDENGMIWPVALAPYHVYFAVIAKSEEFKEMARELYKELWGAGIETLMDDRKVGPGFMFKDSDLLGLPYRVVLGERDFTKDGLLEIVNRKTGEKEKVTKDELIANLKNKLGL